MIKIMIICFLITTLVAQNPKAYATLGDMIYNNVSNIKALKDVKVFTNNTAEIDLYLRDVSKAKECGFDIDSGKKSDKNKKYLFTLRNLSKRYDFFNRKANVYLKKSISEKDNKLFLEIVNSKIIDIEKNKKLIVDYYYANSNDINVTGALKKYLDEQEIKKEKIVQVKKERQKYTLTKKQIQQAKIKRLRRNDKLEEQALEKRLDAELMKKKLQIIKEQERELSY